jgi:ABC-type multidrug transport system fused ATPase/permease subunit
MAAQSSSSKAKAKPDKAARAEAKRAKRAESRQRRKQIFQAFNMQRKQDKLLIPLMAGALVLATVVVFGIGLIFHMQWVVLPLGVALGVLAAIFIFGRRMQRSVYGQAEGQPGAAGWALDQMRGQWRITQGVAGTTQLDAVHRVIGRPGVMLVAEGAPHRTKNLLAQEKKRTARLIGNIPIYDIVVGNDEGQVPLRKLQAHLAKLPRNITPKQMDIVEGRLGALGARTAAMPKGPLPPGAKMRSVQRTVKRR